MKKLLLLPLVILLLVSFSFAYELAVDSKTDSLVILTFSDLKTLDIKFIDVTATAETNTISDTYIVDTSLSTTTDSILLSIDISSLKEDYPQINSNFRLY